MKKFLCAALACAMAFSMAACSSGETTTETTTTEPAKLVIGGIGPITGAAATYGTAVMNSAQIAVDEINAAGGINGMEIEFIFQDDEHDAEKSVNAYNSLKDDGMQVLMGTVTSTPCIAVAEVAAQDNMFLLTPSGSAVDCIAYDNAFRICFSDPNQGIASAQYIKENGLADKVAVIYNSSDVYSQGIYEKFAMESANVGLEIVAAEAFTNDTAKDFSVQLQKVQASGAELVFLPIYYEAAALILTQADSLGLDVKFFGCDGLDGVIPQLGDNAALAEGVMLLTPFAADAEDAATQAFVAKYQEAHGEIPNQFGADAYDAIYVIKAAIEKAGITDANISASDLCEALKAAMVEIEVPGLTGTMTWTADGEPSKTPKAMVIADGAYKAM
ncbi:MAG: ABC transporter substrate-binding protein [Firmicutes bacterium]|nr:ABC transporter substrate-binding protein [Bacillota bacterium]